jgi:L-proline amide hydrolase
MLPLSLLHEDIGIPVIMYDQIGCGGSTRFKDRAGDEEFWTQDLFTAELDNLKKALGITTFDLLGHSWGGILGAYYAISQPKGLRKLIICDSPASIPECVRVMDVLRHQLPPDVLETLERCEREGTTDSEEYEAATMVFYKRHLCRVDPWPTELTDAFEALAEDSTVYQTLNGPNEFYIVGSMKDWTIEDDLQKITPETVPGGILLMNSYFDEVQDECMMPYLTKTTARVKWVRFALSAHIIYLDEPEKVIEAVSAFISAE